MAEQKATNIVWHQGAVTRDDREKLNGHSGCTVWLTGLSGSGKSTIAVDLEKRALGARRPHLHPRRRQHPPRPQQEPRLLARGPHREHPPHRRGREALHRRRRGRADRLHLALPRRPRPGARAHAGGRLRRGPRRLPGRGLRAARREGPLQEGARRRRSRSSPASPPPTRRRSRPSSRSSTHEQSVEKSVQQILDHLERTRVVPRA